MSYISPNHINVSPTLQGSVTNSCWYIRIKINHVWDQCRHHCLYLPWKSTQNLGIRIRSAWFHWHKNYETLKNKEKKKEKRVPGKYFFHSGKTVKKERAVSTVSKGRHSQEVKKIKSEVVSRSTNDLYSDDSNSKRRPGLLIKHFKTHPVPPKLFKGRGGVVFSYWQKSYNEKPCHPAIEIPN